MSSPTTRNAILEAIETELLRLPDLGEVYIGAIAPHKAATAPKAMVWWERDAGVRKDGDLVERRLRLIVGLLFKIDPSDADAQRTTLLEMSAKYDAVHAALESLERDFVAGLALEMGETAEGIEPANFEDDAEAKFIGSAWDIHYQRQRRTT